MMPSFRSLALSIALPMLLLGLAACSGTRPFEVVNPKVHAPEPGRALVMFMRPRRFEWLSGGGGLPAMLYQNDQFLGALPARYQLAWQATPGDYTLMVASGRPGQPHGRADFLLAHLLADRTYYVVIEPSMNFFGLHFRLRPQNGQIEQKRLHLWHKLMPQIRPNEHGMQQAKEFASLQQALKQHYYTQWLQVWERPTLRAASGLPAGEQ